MRAPMASALLDAWERASDASPTARALALLAVGLPNIDATALARLSIGVRDQYLMRLRHTLFGDAVQGVSSCPQCGERLDLSFRLQDIGLDEDGRTPNLIASVTTTDVHKWSNAEYEVEYRLPTSEDLLRISTSVDVPTASNVLLNQCILSAKRTNTANDATNDSIAPADLPPDITTSLLQAMSEADPLAHTQLQLSCPACQHAWLALFDVAHFLWMEVQAWARRTLQDVHSLARAYGWSEREILAMSARRRRLYLELHRA